MSEVLKRFRSTSKIKFLDEAKNLSQMISALVYRKKAVPKKYRNYYGPIILNITSNILINCTTANAIKLTDTETCNQRLTKQTEILGYLDALEQNLAIMEINIPAITPTILKPFAEKIDLVRSLIQGWKKSTIIKKNEFSKNQSIS